MPGIGNNLYPPIIDTYMPAFVRNTTCRVYFSLSPYNSMDDIKNVQVIVNAQNTNASVLNREIYPSGVKITTIKLDEEGNIRNDDKYYIEISNTDLEGNEFGLNQFYKVQIRFGTTIVPNELLSSQKVSNWLVENQSTFSEWSTVCLIKGIEKPSIYLKGFEDMDTNAETMFTTEIIDLVGRMYYANNDTIEKEYLDHYKIDIYNNSTNVLLYSSDYIYTEIYNPNEINYTLPFMLEDGILYRIVITYTTNNEYEDSNSYVFRVITRGIDPLNATITSVVDDENGRIKIDVVSTNQEIFLGNLTIRRTSNKSNFTLWEDVHNTTILSESSLNYTWYDYTAESGIWYRYCAQRRNYRGERGAIVETRTPIMPMYDDIFLVGNGMQLRVRFDPSIDSFQRSISESKTDTIGSKYPFIKRNGNINYRQFSISGLITHFCDDEGIFTNKDNVYKESKQYYDLYNSDNNIDEYQDYIYEKEFRNKVIDFLYENNVKLFKSTTEGNILVKLMEISFSPNQTLGRMLYSFNANAYEIDECTIANYDKYNIQTLGTYSSYVKYTHKRLGQVQETFTSSDNLLTLLRNKYTSSAIEGYVNEVDHLTWLRIEFNSDPYLIKRAGNGLPVPVTASDNPNEDTAYGYIVYINGKPIIVSPRRYYELNDEDTNITSVSFPVNTSVTIDYIVQMNEVEDISKIATRIYYYKRVGQLWGTFAVNQYGSNDIYLKYLIEYKDYYQRLTAIDKITVEAIPGSVIYVKDSFDDTYYRHEIGDTGVLDFYDDEAIISNFYFSGVHLVEAVDPERDEVRDNEFIDTGISAASADEIVNPIKNGVYTIAGERSIYYNEEWYTFSEENDVLCPVEGIVDYIYEVVRGEY